MEDRLISKNELVRYIKKYEAKLTQYPDSIKYRYNLAEVYRNFIRTRLRLDEKEIFAYKAENLYQEALSMRPDFYYARIGLGSLYADQGKISEAIMILEAVNENYPGIDYVILKLGEAKMKSGNFSEARTILNQKNTSFREIEQHHVFETLVKTEVVLRNRDIIELNATVFWKVSNPVLYFNKIDNPNNAERLIKDFFFGRSASFFSSYGPDILARSVSEIEHSLLMHFQDYGPVDYGIEWVDLKQLELIQTFKKWEY